MRVFIAVDIDNPLIVSRIARIKDTITTLNVPVKLVEDENLHITLLFIGEVSDYAVDLIKDSLSDLRFKSFKIHITGLGAFPSVVKPRVVWVGVKEGSKELENLQKEVESRVRRAGVRFQKQEFTPHITVGRVKGVKNITSLSKILVEYQDEDFGWHEVSEVKVKQSILTPKGPIYKDLYVIKASGNGG